MILIRKKRRKKLEKDVKLLRISSVRTKEVDLVKKKKKKKLVERRLIELSLTSKKEKLNGCEEANTRA